MTRPLTAVSARRLRARTGGRGRAVAGGAGRWRGRGRGWVSHGRRGRASRGVDGAETKSADVSFSAEREPSRDPGSVVAARGFERRRRRDDGEEIRDGPTLACGPRPRGASSCAARVLVRARRASPRGRRRARGHENAEETGWQNLNSRVSGSRDVPCCWRLFIGGRRGGGFACTLDSLFTCGPYHSV